MIGCVAKCFIRQFLLGSGRRRLLYMGTAVALLSIFGMLSLFATAAAYSFPFFLFSLLHLLYHTNGTRIFLLGTLSPNSFLSATCFFTLHCAICAALTTKNTQLVSVDVNQQNTSHAANSHV